MTSNEKNDDRMLGLPKPSELLWAFLFFLALSWLVGWKLTLLLMGILMFHELGHASAMRHYGLGVKGFYFIPFAGLAVSPKRMWKTRRQEAVVALMGPLWGLGMATLFAALAVWTESWLFAGLTTMAAAVNLFNLVPINPLDGGRAVKSVGYSISWHFGIAIQLLGILAALILAFTYSPIVGLLVAFIAFMDMKNEIRLRQQGQDRPLIRQAVAKALSVPADNDSISDGIDRLMGLPDDERRAWCQQQLGAAGYTDLLSAAFGPERRPSDPDLDRAISGMALGLLAQEACQPKLTLGLIGSKRPSVSLRELLPSPHVGRQSEFPLMLYLRGSGSLPIMGKTEAAAFFAGYLALAAALAGLFVYGLSQVGFYEYLHMMQ